jgi:hypothetical protein
MATKINNTNLNNNNNNNIEDISDDDAELVTKNNVKINHDSCKIDKCNIFKIKTTKCMGNFCISCSINLGTDNPRQLCRKTYCDN